jgi:Lrp/AsnC family transcriptional regulator, leucine-responsive regulatory protein
MVMWRNYIAHNDDNTDALMQLDEIDLKILQHLQREARISNVDLADRVGLSPAPCLRRVRALEQAGVIRKYVALLDPRALNLNVTVLVQVSLDRQIAERFQAFEQAILDRPEVLECDVTTGPSDFLLRIVVKDVAAYEQFQREFLSRIEAVTSTNSSFALKQVKYFTEFPLSDALIGHVTGPADAEDPASQEPVEMPHRAAVSKERTATGRRGK